MKVDNGTQRRLVIPSVFNGMAGESRGVLAFKATRALNMTVDGYLDGERVRLKISAPFNFDVKSQPYLEARVISDGD